MSDAAVTIRPGRPADLDAIDHLETTVFSMDQLSRRSLRRFLAVPTTDTVVAATATGLAGYAMIGFRRGSRIGRVFSLAVDRREARRGIGAALLQACEDAAWRRGSDWVRLEVRTDNAPAITLYERAGYRVHDRFEDYYEDGLAALAFEKLRPFRD